MYTVHLMISEKVHYPYYRVQVPFKPDIGTVLTFLGKDYLVTEFVYVKDDIENGVYLSYLDEKQSTVIPVASDWVYVESENREGEI